MTEEPAAEEPGTDGPSTGDPLEENLGFLATRLVEHRDLAPLCTYRVGGAARWYAQPADVDELVRVAAAVAALPGTERPEVLVVGKGSNLLVGPGEFNGLVVHLAEGFDEVEVLDGTVGRPRSGTSVPAGARVLRAGAAASLPVVARRSVALGLSGFEWAVGVPGSIGGAVRMNAGGHGSDMAASLIGVRVVDLGTGEDVTVDLETLALGYRSSSLRPEQIVVDADLLLGGGDPAAGEREIGEIVRWRREHQPGGQNAGSVFTNPPGGSAGRLIDEAGCKGLRVGTAEVSVKHANFIQVDPGGSSADVVELMAEVHRRVRAHSGVALHPETVLVGFGPMPWDVGS